MSASQKQVDTARSRGIQLKEILKYDLTTENCLFDGDYTAKTKKKHVLVHELEKLINHNAPQFHEYSSEPAALLVDFLSVIRPVPLKNVSKIINAFDLSWNTINNVCSHNTLNIIYDSYIESSLKACEKDRRSEKDPLEIMNIKLQSPIPVQVERFWSSDQNKESIQALSRNYFIEKARESEKHLTLSGYVTKNNEIKNALEVRNVTFDRQDLALTSQEADQRIIPHLHKTVTEDCKKAIVLCNDTDVLALLLYYIHEFMSNELSELWMKFGIGESSRFIPLHFLASQLGPRVQLQLKLIY